MLGKQELPIRRHRSEMACRLNNLDQIKEIFGKYDKKNSKI